MAKQEIISRESSDTDLTFIGIPDKQFQQIDQTYDDVIALSQHLGTFLLVNSSSKFESFDIGLETIQEADQKPLPVHELRLPELIPSKYNIINEDISKIDSNGQKVLTLFFEKAFVPILSGLKEMSDGLIASTNTVINQIDKINSIDDSYRRRKALIKIKNDFYYLTSLLFNDFDDNKLNTQKKALESGISWYVEQLDRDLLKFPQKITILFGKEDLTLKKNDPLWLKWFILRKRITHPFSKDTIPGKICYNEIAAYYLRNNRHLFLSAFLDKFQTDLLVQFSEVRALIISTDSLLENLFEKALNIDHLNEAIRTGRISHENSINNLRENIDNLYDQVSGRLLLEFRRNLQLMSTDMGKADINFRIKRKSRKKKYYSELILKNSEFPESWFEQTLHQTNKIHMDVLLQSVRSRIKDKIYDLNLNIAQQLDNRFKVELKALRQMTGNSRKRQGKVPDLKITVKSFDESITILKDFKGFGKEILLLATALPEKLVIAASAGTSKTSADQSDFLNVPLRRISAFYLESRFLGATYDKLEKIAESLKNSIFTAQDLLSLARFNLENIPDDLPDKEVVISSIIEDTSQKILKEEDNIHLLKNSIFQIIDSSLDEVFDMLSSYKISETVSEYSWFIREHQSKKVRKTLYAYYDRLIYSFKNLTSGVLYSRSEWILMVRKIMESDQKIATNQKILDIVETVSPKEKVLDQLPQFYKNLFSGRSSISEDFWKSREKDEALFISGVRRNNEGYKGGIMIIGDRNSGKTAFCRYITGKLFKKERVYHIFPVYSGSVKVSDFASELRKVTQSEGRIDEIMGSLQPGSVIVINDLELWWERSVDGLDVIKLLINLINAYSKDILFVVNMNPYAFSLINKMTDLQDAFIGVIPLSPFYSKEIQEIIIRRHRSSGLKFVLNKSEEDEISEIRMAKLFNKYFNYSEGNPGTALKAWLGNIIRVTGNRLIIKYPSMPDTKILTDLDDDWKTVLIQLILHKRLTTERISKIFFMDTVKAKALISSMSRAGLIEEKKDNLYIVNQFLEPHLISVLKKEKLL